MSDRRSSVHLCRSMKHGAGFQLSPALSLSTCLPLLSLSLPLSLGLDPIRDEVMVTAALWYKRASGRGDAPESDTVSSIERSQREGGGGGVCVCGGALTGKRKLYNLWSWTVYCLKEYGGFINNWPWFTLIRLCIISTASWDLKVSVVAAAIFSKQIRKVCVDTYCITKQFWIFLRNVALSQSPKLTATDCMLSYQMLSVA